MLVVVVLVEEVALLLLLIKLLLVDMVVLYSGTLIQVLQMAVLVALAVEMVKAMQQV